MALSDSSLLDLYKEALEAIATGQSYQIRGRTMTRANLREVRETIDWLERRVSRGSDATGGVDLVTFRNPR